MSETVAGMSKNRTFKSPALQVSKNKSLSGQKGLYRMDDGIVVALCAMHLSSVFVHVAHGVPNSSKDHSLEMKNIHSIGFDRINGNCLLKLVFSNPQPFKFLKAHM